MSGLAFLRASSLLLFFLVFFNDDSARAGLLSLEQYLGCIHESIARLASGKGTLNAEECAFIEEHFPPHLDINTKSGEPVRVDNGRLLRLVEENRKTDQGREALISHLKALRSQISFADKPIPLSEDLWDGSHARLEKVFGGKEFRGLEEVKDPAWMVFLKELLKKGIEWLERHRRAVNASGDWLEYVFYGVILGGVFFLVLWIVRSLGPVGWRFRDLKINSEVGRKALGMDWQTLRDASHHKGENGAYREAIRLFFISVLMEGHERGWWIYRREATNREHLGGVEGSTIRREALGKMIQVYENAWYGHERAGKEALLQCAEWLRLMEAG